MQSRVGQVWQHADDEQPSGSAAQITHLKWFYGCLVTPLSGWLARETRRCRGYVDRISWMASQHRRAAIE